MKPIPWRTAAAAVMALLLAAAPGNALTILTEESPPLSTTAGGRPTGFAVEVVDEIRRRLSLKTPVLFHPWARAYRTALSAPDIVLFSMTRTPEREPRFHWVGPLLVAHNGFYARKDRGLDISGLDDARGVGAIATYRGDARDQVLAKMGFTNIDRADSPDGCIKKLVAGRVDLWLTDSLGLPEVARRNRVPAGALEMVFAFHSYDLYIALSLETPEALAAQWQRALDDMKADGRFAALAKQWLPPESTPSWVLAPSPLGYPRPRLSLYTEDSPPGNYLENGEIKGFSVALVREIARRLALPDTVTVVPWARGYHMAQSEPGAAVFSTTRLAQRESMFKWVGPLYRQQWALFARKDHGLKVDSLSAARQVGRIGTYLQDAKALYLRDLGFTNLVSATDNSVNIRHLLGGRIDLWASSDFNMPYQLRQAGEDPGALENVFTFQQVENFIAFNPNTPDPVIAAWQRTLDAIRAEGLYDRLYRNLVRFEPTARHK